MVTTGSRWKGWSLRFFVVLAIACSGPAGPSVGESKNYKLAEAAAGEPKHPALAEISRNVAAIAAEASKAVVFVSTSKMIEGTPFEMIDPFEFFFGPEPFGQRHGPQQPPPKEPPKHRAEGVGSGFIVDLEQGYIITNNHVVEGADEINLKLANAETYDARVIGRDKRTDIAVVKVKDKSFRKEGLAALTMADSSKVSVGDFVIALGAPFGLEASVSFGVVSALGRGSLGITELGDFIQTDAAINPGNSGGPLLDAAGQVIGVNTAIFSQSGAYAGVGFAVPSMLARRVAEELITDGKIERGYLGVKLQRLEPGMAESMNLPLGTHGALIASVDDGTPAAQAGIAAGDVITAVNEKPIKNEVEVTNTIGLLRPGTEVKLAVLREGRTKSFDVKLGRYPGGDQGNGAKAEGRGGELGLSVAPLTSQLSHQYGLKSKGGALVDFVENGSPAERAGLERGDLIVQVNGKVIDKPKDFWAEAKGKDRLLLRIERTGDFFFVTLRKSGGQG